MKKTYAKKHKVSSLTSRGEKEMLFQIKRDKFRSARGGTSQFFNIFCSSCGSWILLYQKDGSGMLYRLYFDRIHAPVNLAQLQKSYIVSDVSHIPSLRCSCGQLVAHPMIYDKENRLAYRLIQGTFVKQRSNGIIP